MIFQTDRYDTTHTRLLCFSGVKFNDKARNSADASPEIHFIGPRSLDSRERS